MEINDKVMSLLNRIEEKYRMDEQEFEGYLEGLIYNQYLDYWDYINLDALLNLQHPRTNIPDEMIFIVYHQLTELYFKLCLWEYKQIGENMGRDVPMLLEHIRRINSYFYNLTRSFEIMIDGMQPEQFLKFRLSLLPASGFQSVQYRMIEMASTDMINLVDKAHRDEVRGGSLEEQYQYIYWKFGATDIATGKKTLTLQRFEAKYAEVLMRWAHEHQNNNLWQIYQQLPDDAKQDQKVIDAYRELDLNVNVRWPIVHLKSAARYLLKGQNHGVAATGGTNWQKYLPAKVQRRVFFPDLFTPEELQGWGSSFR